MSVSEQDAWDEGYACGKLDAADRIEALEAALREIKDKHLYADQYQAIASKALALMEQDK